MTNEKMTKQEAYCAYLKGWAESHSAIGFEGCTPACFGEWLMCEGSEDQEDTEPSIAPCDICRDGPAAVFDELALDSRYDPFVQALNARHINICRECFDAAMDEALRPGTSVVIHASEGQTNAVFAPEQVTSGFYYQADFDDFYGGEIDQRLDLITNFLRAYSPGMQELA